MARILVVDDEPIVLSGCEASLKESGYDVKTALSAEVALSRINIEKYDVIITDLKMPGLSGMELLKIVKSKEPETDVVMITGYASTLTAIEAMKLGAFDYIPKPFTPDELRGVVARAIERRNMLRDERRKTEKSRVVLEYNIPDNLYYLPEHSWARVKTDNLVEVGIDDVFQRTIGNVMNISLLATGSVINQGDSYATLYGPAAQVYKLWSPVGGEIKEANANLKNDLSLLNKDPYEAGWIVRIKPSDLHRDLANLLYGDELIKWWLRREIVERKLSKYVNVSALDPNFKHEIAAQPGGENIQACFACGICTASCPVREIDSQYNPRKIIRMALLGMRERVLTSEFIWLCSACYNCAERCPQGVKFTEIINAIKNIAVKEGHIHPAFTAQIELLAQHGRLYEIDDFENRKRESLGLPKITVNKEIATKTFDKTGLMEILKIKI